MTKGTEVKTCLLNFGLIHLMFTSFAPIIVPTKYGLATNNTSREIGPTFPATSIILADLPLATFPGTLNLLARSFFGRMFRKDANSHIDVLLPLVGSPHPLELYECP
jgi:hypothetical protein